MHLVEFIQIGSSIDLSRHYFLWLFVIEDKDLIVMFEREYHTLYSDIVERRKKLTVNEIAKLGSQQVLHIQVILRSSLLILGLDRLLEDYLNRFDLLSHHLHNLLHKPIIQTIIR